MEPLFYSTGHAARELGVSQARIRDLCRSGAITAEVTEGGQFRIPRQELEKLLKREGGLPPLPKPLPNGKPVLTVIPAPSRRSHPALLAAPSEEVIDSAEDVVLLENEIKSLGLRRQKEEQLDWFREREEREAERASQRLEAESRRQLEEAAEQRRQNWKNEWMEYGLNQIPSTAPQSFRLDVHQAVVEALDRCAPGDTASTVHQLVDAAVDRALTPWRNAKEIADAIEDLCESSSASWDMRRDFSWKARMYQAAGTALGHLRDGATLTEMKAAAKQVVAALVHEFEHKKVCEHLVTTVGGSLGGATVEEREQGEDAVGAALGELPVGTFRTELERVRENALESTRAKIAARQDRAMRDGMLQWIELRYKVMALPREEQQKVLSEIKMAFGELPVGTSRVILDDAVDTVVDRHYSVHELRERERKETERREAEQERKRRDAEYKANSYLSHIGKYLQAEYEFDGGYFEMCRERDRLQGPIRKAVTEELVEDPVMSADDIRARIEELVDSNLD